MQNKALVYWPDSCASLPRAHLFILVIDAEKEKHLDGYCENECIKALNWKDHMEKRDETDPPLKGHYLATPQKEIVCQLLL